MYVYNHGIMNKLLSVLLHISCFYFISLFLFIYFMCVCLFGEGEGAVV